MVENGSQYKVYSDGTKMWRTGEKLHRIDGPAFEHADGHASWYLNGKKCKFNEFLELTPISPEEKFMLKLRYG